MAGRIPQSFIEELTARADIVELQRQMQQGITALKDTKLGKTHGRAALYVLPWYAIIGPPGSGKTTALRHC